MAALNFPSSPSNGQTYTANNVTYVWNGTAWKKNIPSQSTVSGINTVGGVVNVANDLDVDGHTNLDNVSVAGISTFNSDVEIGNAVTFHDNGGQFQLKTGYFNVKSKVGEDMLIAYNNEYVRLFHDGNQKFTTTRTGAIVTGIMTATSFSGDGSNLTGLPEASPMKICKHIRQTSNYNIPTGNTSWGQAGNMTMSFTIPSSDCMIFYNYNVSFQQMSTNAEATRFRGRVLKNGSFSHYWLPEENISGAGINQQTRSAEYENEGVNSSTLYSLNDSITIDIQIRNADTGTGNRTQINSGSYLTIFVIQKS